VLEYKGSLRGKRKRKKARCAALLRVGRGSRSGKRRGNDYPSGSEKDHLGENPRLKWLSGRRIGEGGEKREGGKKKNSIEFKSIGFCSTAASNVYPGGVGRKSSRGG